MKQQLFGLARLGLVGLVWMGPAYAQPDINNPPKAANPPNRNRAGQKAAGLRAGPAGEDRRARLVRRMLALQGVGDKKLMEAISAHLQKQDEAERPVAEAGMKVAEALRARALAPAQMDTLYHDYKAAVDQYLAQRKQAEAELDKKIGFSKNDRLQAILLLAGVIGDAPSPFEVRLTRLTKAAKATAPVAAPAKAPVNQARP